MGQYQAFGNKLTVAAGDALNPTTQINQQFDGVQDEFELRDGDGWLDGIVSGLEPVTTNGTSSLTVPAGRAYGGGKRYAGGESYTITGSAAGTYKLYWQTSSETTSLYATTGSLNSGQFQLATFTWDGAGTVSTAITLTDNGTGSKHGLYRYSRDCRFAGVIATTSRFILPIKEDSWFEGMDAICVNNGTSGNLVFDCLLGSDASEGTTVFTTTTRRPSIAAAAGASVSYTIAASGEADGARAPSAGQHLTIKPVEVFGTGTASEATVTVYLRPR